jgi:hypothetical protein
MSLNEAAYARRLGGTTASGADRSTTRLGDWYVNVLFFKPQVALFVGEATLLPVLTPSLRL